VIRLWNIDANIVDLDTAAGNCRAQNVLAVGCGGQRVVLYGHESQWLRIEGHAGEVPDRAGGAPGVVHGGLASEKGSHGGNHDSRVCVVLEMATFPAADPKAHSGAECLAAADWRASSGERVCGPPGVRVIAYSVSV